MSRDEKPMHRSAFTTKYCQSNIEQLKQNRHEQNTSTFNIEAKNWQEEIISAIEVTYKLRPLHPLLEDVIYFSLIREEALLQILRGVQPKRGTHKYVGQCGTEEAMPLTNDYVSDAFVRIFLLWTELKIKNIKKSLLISVVSGFDKKESKT